MHTSKLAAIIGLVALSMAALSERSFDNLDEPRNAPAFELPATDGSTRRLADFRGRYVMINFWAVWCSPCRREMPSMQRAYEQLKGKAFEMLAVHVGPSLDGARQFSAQLGLSFPILVDADMDLASWDVQGLPTTFLVDPQGRIVAKAVGEREWDDPTMLERLVDLME